MLTSWIKQRFCKHDWTYVHPINAKLRSYWVCVKCGRRSNE
jgi:hypothetical protein